jgi:fatty acid desaturase
MPPDNAAVYDLKAGAYALAFYCAYVAVVLGRAPVWLFAAIGPLLLIRNFSAAHETFHARPSRITAALHHILIVVAPYQLGYRAHRRNHGTHHQGSGGPQDADAYLVNGSLIKAVFNAFTQPEQSFVRHVAREGLGTRAVLALVGYGSLFAVMMAAGGWRGALLYNVVVRIGNAGAWVTFHWWMHRPEGLNEFGGIRLPGAARALWRLAFGGDNLAAVEHHGLHHDFPWVPDRHLSRLAQRSDLAALESANA